MKNKKIIFILIYSLVMSALIILIASLNQYDYCVPTRIEKLQLYMDFLAGKIEKPVIRDSGTRLYYYLAPLSLLLNIDSAYEMYVFVKNVMMGLLTFTYPIVFYALFKKFSVAIAAPVILFLFTASNVFLPMTDSTWIMEWIVLFSAPLIMLSRKYILEEKRKWGEILFLAIAFLCSISNLFRAHSGTIILVLSILYISKKRTISIKELVYRSSVVVIAVTLFTTIVPFVNNKVLRKEDYGFEMISAWHTIYIGIGWEDNPWGIYYKDECGMESVPNEVYNSPEYLEALRDKTIGLVRENPGWFIASYLKKAVYSLAYSFFYSAVGAVLWKTPNIYRCISILATIGLLFGMYKNKLGYADIKNSIGVLIIAIMMALVFPLMATPEGLYVYEVMGIIQFIEIYFALKIVDNIGKSKNIGYI